MSFRARLGKAKVFNEQLQLDAQFICCDIYDLPNHLDEKFDIVFTSYGTIGWLPDITKWANEVSQFLKPKGKFIMADFHPVVWMYDNDFAAVFYSYFNNEPIIEEESGTYADQSSEIQTTTIGWNHPTSEVLNALIQSGLEINSFNEYDYSPYNCFNETEEFETGKFRIKHLGNKIPMIFSILATQKK
jgi:ubiquinone/menaquinone biosynthesis C-methylase UbiE